MNLFDFRFREVMKLSSIKRWGIIDMSRSQSVAEHSYNVAAISMMLVNSLELPTSVKNALVLEVTTYALAHDLPELYTGDIPSACKQGVIASALESYERDKFPLLKAKQKSLSNAAAGIVKIADYIDAIQFAERFCVDDRKSAIIGDMEVKMLKIIQELELSSGHYLSKAVESIWLG